MSHTAGRKSGTVIQALRHLGQRHVDDKVLAILRRQLNADDKVYAAQRSQIRSRLGWRTFCNGSPPKRLESWMVFSKCSSKDRRTRLLPSGGGERMHLPEPRASKKIFAGSLPDAARTRSALPRNWTTSYAFKGGTSLSKAWKLTERFSEDIDLIRLDKQTLGFAGDASPDKARGKKQLQAPASNDHSWKPLPPPGAGNFAARAGRYRIHAALGPIGWKLRS